MRAGRAWPTTSRHSRAQRRHAWTQSRQMIVRVPLALRGACRTGLGAKLADLVHERAVPRHRPRGEPADRRAVEVRANAVGHHPDVVLRQACGGAVVAGVRAEIARFDTGVVMLLHGRAPRCCDRGSRSECGGGAVALRGTPVLLAGRAFCERLRSRSRGAGLRDDSTVDAARDPIGVALQSRRNATAAAA